MAILNPIVKGEFIENNDDWKMFRHDSQHMGYQSIKGFGDISKYGLLWYKDFTNDNMIYGEPTVANIDLKSGKEIIIGNDNGYIYCLNLKGEINWKFDCNENSSDLQNNRVSSTVTLVNLIGDKYLEILFGCGNGKVYCISSKGKKLWDFQTNGTIDSSVAIGDITGNGELDLAFTSYDGYLYTLNNTGKLIWKFNLEDSSITTPIIIDINNDNLNEIIVGAINGKIYTISTNQIQEKLMNHMKYFPNLRWTFEISEIDNLGIIGSPCVLDINNDKKFEIIFGTSDSYLYCLNDEGEILWSLKTDGPIYNTPAIADIDNNNNYEIIIGTSGNKLFAIDSKGNLIWDIIYRMKVKPNPVISDIDGDGFLEIISMDISHSIFKDNKKSMIFSINVLNYNGEIIKRLKYKQKCYDFICGITVADLESDGKLEILTGTEKGYLYCYGELEINNDKSKKSNSIPTYLMEGSIIMVIIIIISIIKFRVNR